MLMLFWAVLLENMFLLQFAAFFEFDLDLTSVSIFKVIDEFALRFCEV